MSQLAEVESQKAVAIREAELQKAVEQKNALTRMEKLRADHISKATVEYDIKVQEANAELYKKQKEAVLLFQQQKQAEAQKVSADATLYCRQQEADAQLYTKAKEPEGINALAEGQAYYLGNLLKEVNGNYNAVRDFMMVDRGFFQDIAKTNAEAVRGLQPKITLWSGGATGGSSGGNALKDITGVYSMLPPLLQTVHDQTGMLPPAWLGTLPSTDQSAA